jgi:bacterial leucyl aminopeptidase
MKKLITASLILASFSTLAGPGRSKYLSINSSILKKISPLLSSMPKAISTNKDITIIKVPETQIEEVSAIIHSQLNRCGGFMAHESLALAEETLKTNNQAPINPLIEYVINQQDTVQAMVDDVREEQIRAMIAKLSSFETRHYKSNSGIESSEYIKEAWSKLSKHRSDVKVELFKHKNFPQPSIVLTIEGSESPEEIIVLGGHADSISDEHMAPGADDNASGIASITETIRILMSHDFKPKRTLQFMAYAAEEVGLFGSQEIARSYRTKQSKVIGLMQLDMTLFKGSADKDIVLISDYTNKEQNLFLGKLVDEYVKVAWGYSKCGYACSDHASWSAMGYPASFPFEARFGEYSPLIHTVEDKLENYGDDASHSVKFSKLATAFMVEMSN